MAELAKRCLKEAREITRDLIKHKLGQQCRLQKVVEKPLREILDGRTDFSRLGLHFSAIGLVLVLVGEAKCAAFSSTRGFLNPGDFPSKPRSRIS